ncbi:unnamed protein product [Caenorhabditis auriculariae]|uniref:FBA domain-containing protein n=1 Tax=Caenorhabditis auriculariae TaxID=2777116 RepID=A0A8S1H5J2_9PELO|nr:unnamed protein product [Caenorhabditis auriculariae]
MEAPLARPSSLAQRRHGEDESNRVLCQELLPPDLWREILMRTSLYSRQFRNLPRTCRVFKEILSDVSFWVRRAKIEGQTSSLPPVSWLKAFRSEKVEVPEDVDATGFFFDCARILHSNRGYDKNPALEISDDSINQKLRREIEPDVYGDGDGLSLEIPPRGCFVEDVRFCFSTTCDFGSYNTMIYLSEDWGIEEWVLDYIRPTIRITELVAHQKNCASEYQIYAKLLRRDMGYYYDPKFYLDPKFHSHCKMEKREWPENSDCGWEEHLLWWTRFGESGRSPGSENRAAPSRSHPPAGRTPGPPSSTLGRG